MADPARSAGWAAYRAARQLDGLPPPAHHHGNQRHGRWSAEGIATARLIRQAARMLRQGLWDVPLPGLPPPPAGWGGAMAANDTRPLSFLLAVARGADLADAARAGRKEARPLVGRWAER
ncbi:hypothetical protein LPC08_01710 [Roseomonas sp. OT10]|uniref:hypothetical protein n=1 Tax=Roseomonas cutis TaxID=2897332 RepID=UPI001E38841D|nr:hypothetical protein [Roseomonas sp. OT10]UFN49388.1 hypothetical protein LPC08_01710 [Roseomonas sp. OT10]